MNPPGTFREPLGTSSVRKRHFGTFWHTASGGQPKYEIHCREQSRKTQGATGPKKSSKTTFGSILTNRFLRATKIGNSPPGTIREPPGTSGNAPPGQKNARTVKYTFLNSNRTWGQHGLQLSSLSFRDTQIVHDSGTMLGVHMYAHVCTCVYGCACMCTYL